MHARPIRLLLATVLAVAMTGCAETYKIRPIQLDESAALTIAADPLLKQVGLIGPRRSCTMAVTLNDVQARVLEVLPGSGSEYCLGFYVSSGALALPPAELRGLIAHGLAHLVLGHARTSAASSGSSRARARGYVQGRPHSLEEEAEADREAARLLTTAAGGSACAGLGEVLERVAAEGDRWSEWTEQHPQTPRRAIAARGLCAGKR
jgi:hypothetical protein